MSEFQEVPKEKIELFVPGRLCLFGEHSDWASEYRKENPQIEKGYAIVSGIEQGIYAQIEKDDHFEMISSEGCSICIKDLEKELEIIAKSESFYAYACGAALYMIERFHVKGLKIRIQKSTLPVKKGLSSSTAICVLVVKAYNILYDLELSKEEEMECAYLGERKTPSKCGRLDQICALGKKTVWMEFNGEDVKINEIKLQESIYLVLAIINGQKNTIQILQDLSSAYPFAKNEIDRRIHKTLGKKNKNIVQRAMKYIQIGETRELGKLMTYAQQEFDKHLMPKSQVNLEAPQLHRLLNDPTIKGCIYGGKCVGSGGDGTVQFVAKNKETQKKLCQYLKEKFQIQAYTLCLERNV